MFGLLVLNGAEALTGEERTVIVAEAETPAADRRRKPPLSERLTEMALGYQRVLESNPRHPQALIGMSLVALASRQTGEAVVMAEAAVAAAPEMGSAWVTLGHALKTAARMVEAGRAFGEAILLDPIDAAARTGMAEWSLATERPEEAIREYQLALRRQPTLVAAHLGLGHALVWMERYQEAMESYETALTLCPRLPEGEFAAGFALARMGKNEEAEIRYRRALVERPEFAAAWMNLGCLLRELGREIASEAALRRAVELQPEMIAGWLNLALLERDRRRPLAEQYLRKAFALDPEQTETHVAWAQFCEAGQDWAGAWGWVRWALMRDARSDEAVNMQGILLHLESRFAEAVEAFARAEALGNRPAASNRGNSLLDLGRPVEALRAHETAVERDPKSAGARYNLSLTRLRLGDWKQGWPGYEARWSFHEVHRGPRKFDRPRWQGESLEGRRVLLHAEQGLGDTIQFCRYATQVAARGGTPILQVQGPVERLLGSLPAVRAGQAQIVAKDATLPAFELECALMSLPAVFGTTVETVPWPGAYLGADPDLVEARQGQMSPLKPSDGPRVGLAWAGNPHYKADRQRSMKLETLLPLLRTPGIAWISLQKGEPMKQAAGLPSEISLEDACSSEKDLADTAAVMATLDLVITTDTCIAHLAGAMGKPVWIMLPYVADWRWMQDVETTPWYPTARLIRQTAPGDWNGVLLRVIAELRAI